MIKDIYLKKKLTSSWFSLLQQTICYEFEKIETDFGKKTKQKSKYFEQTNWKILVYNGDIDISTVPHPYTQLCLSALQRPTVKPWA